ncbi:ribosomal L7Ae/L30e/S12e/Gadd45 family protein [Candidatus Woesearchaeota archaeon]|nr:ribosomal L7Ae/L30e/S12e/Gadd45 family protein [Candidatus Woesearchaeota archaeon]
MSIEKLKKALREEKIIYGIDNTIKDLKLGKAKCVFLAKNCPDKIREEIKKYKTEVIELEESSDEIALVCKRPHQIIVLSC